MPTIFNSIGWKPDSLPPEPPPQSKPLVESKTLIVNAIIALAAIYPPVGKWVSEHAVLTMQLIVYANMALRLITKDRLTLFRSDS
jgi:hypothetical protein